MATGTNAHEFAWTAKRLQAVELLAAGMLTHDEVAESIDVAPSTLTRWKGYQTFNDAIAAAKQVHIEAIKAEGIANKQNQIDYLNDRHRRLLQVIEERAADDSMADVPGGKTGLIVRTYKAVGFGEDMELLPEYNVDTGLLSSLLNIEKQGAQLAGIWEDKLNVSGALRREYVVVTEDAD